MNIPRPPASVKDTAIFKKLLNHKPDSDGLLAKANAFIDVANPLLDSIVAGPFRQYTLHNRDHARKLLHIAEHIILRDTLESLGAIECLFLIYASYLHDMGMAISQAELTDFLEGGKLTDILNEWPHLKSALERERENTRVATSEERAIHEVAIADIYHVASTAYFRPIHATPARYESLIDRINNSSTSAELFQIRGISFKDELIDICVSHNLSASVLGELRNAHEERFPRRLIIADHSVNTQFIAALLRITDILDFDFERTPRVLFDSLGLKHRSLPGSDVSLLEWQKHLAVQQLELHETELVVRARSKHPAIEAAVRGFATIIEEEIRTTLSIIRRNEQSLADRYRFRLPSNVRVDIRAEGYKYLDLSLSLDESAIMTLLMGTELYRTPYAAIRELAQNSADACLVKQALRPELGQSRIKISSDCDEEGRRWILVQDNGAGMDEYVLRSYFLRVGRSYYCSSDFDRLIRATCSERPALTSRFGIGFLACFMLADLVEIETTPLAPRYSSDSPLGLRVSVERLGALAYVQEIKAIRSGTTVRLRLSNSLKDYDKVESAIYEYIKNMAIRLPAELEVDLSGRRHTASPGMYNQLREKLLPPDGIDQEKFHAVSLELNKYSDIFVGYAFLFFVSNAKGEFDVYHEERPLRILEGRSGAPGTINIPWRCVFRTSTIGNRVTVGGFRMQLNRLGMVLRLGKTTVPSVFDFDIKPGPHVKFDVSRTRIIDDSVALRTQLRKCIRTGLADKGLWGKLSERCRKAIDLPNASDMNDPFYIRGEDFLRRSKRLIEDEELLEKVLALLPTDVWPLRLHHAVAEQLCVSPEKAFNAISTLLQQGRTKNPNQ